MTDKRAQYEIIADRLEQDILNGALGCGKMPSENELTKTYSVSRPVVREALKLLKARGLISGRQGAPTVITEYGVADFKACLNRIAKTHGASAMHVYDVRTALEVASAASAAQNATPADVCTLQEIAGKMAALDRTDVRGQTALDIAFHVAVAKASGNPLLSFTTQAFAEQVEQVIMQTMGEFINDDAADFHAKIVDAIARRDVVAATCAMQEHLASSRQKYETFSGKERL